MAGCGGAFLGSVSTALLMRRHNGGAPRHPGGRGAGEATPLSALTIRLGSNNTQEGDPRTLVGLIVTVAATWEVLPRLRTRAERERRPLRPAAAMPATRSRPPRPSFNGSPGTAHLGHLPPGRRRLLACRTQPGSWPRRRRRAQSSVCWRWLAALALARSARRDATLTRALTVIAPACRSEAVPA